MHTPLDHFISGGFFLPNEWIFGYIDHLIGVAMHTIIEFFHDFNLATCIMAGLIVWFMQSRAKRQENRNEKRIDALYEILGESQVKNKKD